MNSSHVLWQSGCSDSAAMEQRLLSSLGIYKGYHAGWVDNCLIHLNKIPGWWQDQCVFPRLFGCWIWGAWEDSRPRALTLDTSCTPGGQEQPLLSLPFEDSLPSFILKFSKGGEVPFSRGLKRLFLLFLINFLSKLSRKKSLSVWGCCSLCRPPGKQPWPLRA